MKRSVDWVDPLIDSANRRFFFLTTASRPFGMVNLSPDTRVGGDGWQAGYRYDDKHVHWFSHVHAWQLCGIPVLPTMGECKGKLGSDEYKSGFLHEKEVAKAGYHQVYLEDYKINAELTSTTRVGFHKYTFEEAGDANIIVDLGATIMLPMSDCRAEITAPNEIRGYVENDRTFRRPKRTKIFFVIQFDRDVEKYTAWRDGEDLDFKSVIVGDKIGLSAGFSVKANDVIKMKVAISYCSTDQAKLNLEEEVNHWDFEKVRGEAADQWDEMLSRIEIEGGTDAHKTKFYTDEFHALKGRRIVSDVNGKYLDMTGDLPQVRSIPLDEDGKPQYNHHNSDAFWGAPWTLNLAWAMAWPEVTSSFANTLVDMYKNGGLIPRGPSGGNYTFVMTAPSSTTFLASAYHQGIRDFDIDSAYKGMVLNHSENGLMAKAGYEHNTFNGGGAQHYLSEGYVPQGIEAEAMHIHAGATMTLEYAYHDWALAQLSQALGVKEDHLRFMKRSENYKNIWDESTKYMRPKNKDGSFVEESGHYTLDGWEEGNAQQYRWYVPHDPKALIELFGGEEIFCDELNKLFELAEPQKFVAIHDKHHEAPMDYGNQPCMYLAHLFCHAGKPWLTQKWVRRICDAVKSDITPYGGYGGDEDQGQMGCLNVLFSVGLFSVNGACATEPTYEISTPRFDRAVIKLSDKYYSGKEFVIETENNGSGDKYIQSATLNGVDHNSTFLSHKDLIAGGTLKLVLGDTPNENWGI